MIKVLLCAASVLLLSFSSAHGQTELPSLGNSSSSIVSAHKEYTLGRAWLQALRSQVRTIEDAEIKEYTENLIYRLVETSQVSDRRLEIVVIDSPELNAFAVPGGIIGINSGLFLHAESEQQFASVIAHELAHLSQRHFARNVEESERNRLPSLAATLGSVILLAAGGGDAGIAALATSQAAIISKQLSFSRQNEREADHLGIVNLSRAQMDPRAMPAMFESMNHSSRYMGAKLPEFLSSHPVTEKRIAESRARAEQYPLRHYPDNPRYQLLKNRIKIHHENNSALSIKRLQTELNNGSSSPRYAVRFSLAEAQRKAGFSQQARATLQPLLKKNPSNIDYLIAMSRIEEEAGDNPAALNVLHRAIAINPDSFPLLSRYAELLGRSQEHEKAQKFWNRLSKQRPNDPDIWYQLAEVRGQNKNIIGVHQARSEYFRLTGDIGQAIIHLKYALKLAEPSNFSLNAKLNQKIKNLQAYQKNMDF